MHPPHTHNRDPPTAADERHLLHHNTCTRTAPPLGEGFYESWAGLSRSYGGAQRIHPLQMVLLLHDAGARLRGAAAPFAFASERVLPHVARALGAMHSFRG